MGNHAHLDQKILAYQKTEGHDIVGAGEDAGRGCVTLHGGHEQRLLAPVGERPDNIDIRRIGIPEVLDCIRLADRRRLDGPLDRRPVIIVDADRKQREGSHIVPAINPDNETVYRLYSSNIDRHTGFGVTCVSVSMTTTTAVGTGVAGAEGD
jgi:hypothetical protein